MLCPLRTLDMGPRNEAEARAMWPMGDARAPDTFFLTENEYCILRER